MMVKWQAEMGGSGGNDRWGGGGRRGGWEDDEVEGNMFKGGVEMGDVHLGLLLSVRG